MTNRKQPFGYKICRGKPVIYEAEAYIVRQIFKAYLSGASYSTITDMLHGQAVSYDEGKAWNKNMIARILGDRRYIGNDVYPQIISAADFSIVQRQRESRTKICAKTEAQKALSKLCSVQLSAQLEQQVLSILNLLSMHPEKIRPQLGSIADHDDSEFQRKLDSIMLVQPVDEVAARGLIFQEAAALYEQVNTRDYESERLQRLFEKAAHSAVLDSQLLKSSVAGIYVESLSVKLLLWNGQYIGKDDFK